MRAGTPIRVADIVKPDLVQRDQNVTVIYQVPGIYLTTRGKAIESGAEGDTVSVLNLQSKRTLSGVVTGRGQVPIARSPMPPLEHRCQRGAAAVAAARRNRPAPRSGQIASPIPQLRRSTSQSKFMSTFSSTVPVARLGPLLALARSAAAAPSIDRLSQIGEQPKLSAIDNPTTQPGYKPVQMPMPKPESASYNPNSLWRNGSRAFFKDQRAHQVGDILTVTVNINDKAKIANETQRSRNNKEDSGITDFIGAKTLPPRPRRCCPAASSPPTRPRPATARAR